MRTQPLEGPRPGDLYRPRVRFRPALAAVWRSRELIRTLTERELRARYKQAALGFAWAIVTPLAMVVAFSLFLNRFAKVPTHGVPYPLFAYVGLLPWTFFSSSIASGGGSLLSNNSLLNKVYCPREVFPISSVVVAAVDSATSLLAMGVLFLVYGVAPTSHTVWVPVLLAVQVAFTLGLTFIFSSAVVYVRDIRHAMSLILQFGLFVTPVAYGIEMVPGKWRPWYAAMNPLAPVIDGYRRTVLLGKAPQWNLLVPGALTASVVLVGGYLLFKRLEGGLADVA
ncbi:MAG TPA: ABC transporter permease [Acidimicrobiales bacterium]|nr:ABC transporter permease [Acidimicrobiales bacterium]